MNDEVSATTAKTPSRGPLLIGAVLVGALLGAGAVIMIHGEATMERGAAEAAKAEADLLMAQAEEALERLETKTRRRALADEVFPLPLNPFGSPGSAGPVTAQIPPPPPRMHEILRTEEIVDSPVDPAPRGVPKLKTAEAAQAVEMAKSKEADQDIVGALKHLDLANHLEPDHPEILYRMGLLYDKLGNRRRAVELLQVVAAMDQQAGELAGLALHHLSGTQPGESPDGLKRRPLRIGPAFAEVSQDDGGGRTVKLSLSIRAIAGQEIDPQAVVPYIYFYDLVEGVDILPCEGEQPPVEEVNPWRSEDPDYKDPEEELLDVTYRIPPTDDGIERQFFGYVVKLYYQDEIQDVLVEPRLLVELLSDPEQAQPDSELDATLFEN